MTLEQREEPELGKYDCTLCGENLPPWLARHIEDDGAQYHREPGDCVDDLVAKISTLTADNAALRAEKETREDTVIAFCGRGIRATMLQGDPMTYTAAAVQQVVANETRELRAEVDAEYAVRKHVLHALSGQGLPRVLPENGHGVITDAHALFNRAYSAERELTDLRAMVEAWQSARTVCAEYEANPDAFSREERAQVFAQMSYCDDQLAALTQPTTEHTV